MKRSEAEEARLIARTREGDASAAEALLSPYKALLASLAGRFLTQGVQTEELVQAGYVGMLRAARRYDPGKGVRFVTYAVPWILGEMRRTVRRALDATGAYDRRGQIARAQETLSAALLRAPSAAELAAACGLTPWELMQALCVSSPLSLDGETQPGGGALSTQERIGGGEIDLDAVDLRIALGRLDEEARKVILLRYFSDRTQRETAQALNKSQAQVSRVERRALDALHELLRPERA